MWGSLRANVVLESPLVVALSRSMQALNLTYRATLSWGEQNADWIETFLYYRDVLGIRYAPPLSKRTRLVGRPRPLLHVVVALPPILHRK